MRINFSEKLFLQGSLYLTLSKIFFMISGYIIVFTLSYLLKPEVYGIYSSVTSVLAIINTIILSGSMLTVSKIVADPENKDKDVLQQSLLFQFILGSVVSAVYFIISPYIAGFLMEPKLTLLFQLSSLIVFCYSIYSIFAGYLNGKKKFLFQALLDAFFSFLKLFFIVLFTIFVVNVGKLYFFDKFDKAYFLLIGNATSTICIVCMLLVFVKRSKCPLLFNETINTNFVNYIKLLFPTAMLAFLITFILQLDLLLVKKFESLAITGIYSLSIQVARIPYYLVTGVIFAIFPIVAELSALDRRTEILQKVRLLVKYYFIIMCFVTSFVSAKASTIFTLLFTKDYLLGREVLSVYIFSVLLFALFYILVISYTAFGRPKFSCLMAFMLLCFDFIIYFIVIPPFGIFGAAYGSLFSNLIVLIILAVKFFKDFGSIIELKTAITVIISNIIVFISLLGMNFDGYIPFMLEILFCFCLYSFLIWSSRRLNLL